MGVLSSDTPTSFYVYCALDEFSSDNFGLLRDYWLPISSYGQLMMRMPRLRDEMQNNSR